MSEEWELGIWNLPAGRQVGGKNIEQGTRNVESRRERRKDEREKNFPVQSSIRAFVILSKAKDLFQLSEITDKTVTHPVRAVILNLFQDLLETSHHGTIPS